MLKTWKIYESMTTSGFLLIIGEWETTTINVAISLYFNSAMSARILVPLSAIKLLLKNIENHEIQEGGKK